MRKESTKTTALLFQKVSLCNFCQLRLGLKMKGRSTGAKEDCYICGGMLEQTNLLANQIEQKLKPYQFENFLIGASVPHTILDREDEIRSRFKIKGKDSAKSQITKLLSEKIRLCTGKAVNYSRPDITILASMGESQITVSARSVWLSGRYLKLRRGIAQRSTVCEVCSGLGCAHCNYRGRAQDSVQARITDFLTRTFQAENCNFVWLGSEDENSLVIGTGRPFFVEIVEPKKRLALSKINSGKTKRSTRGKSRVFFRSKDLRVIDLVQLDRRVTEVPQFEISAVVNLRLKKDHIESLTRDLLDSIEKTFAGTMVRVRLSRKFRTVQKEIHSITCKSEDNGNRVQLEIQCDGGVPLKKLVASQDGSVEPNLSQYFSSYEVDSEKPFDILSVRVKEAKAPGNRDQMVSQRSSIEGPAEGN